MWVTDKDYTRVVFPMGKPLTDSYKKCRFSFADLDQVVISGATFNECSFENASLVSACLIQTHFIDCNLKGTTIEKAVIRDCRFTRCNLNHADFTSTGGLSTCIFDFNCSGMDTIKGAKAYKDPLRMTIGWIVRPTYNDTPAQKAEGKPLTETKEELVDPKPLPPTNHYRSPPNKVLKGLGDDEGDWNNREENDWEMYAGWGDYCVGVPSAATKRKYGYMENAVLECPDIDEFRRYTRDV